MERNNLYIPLSEEQKELARPLLMKVKNGDAVFGQLWKDGMHVVLIDAENVKKLAEFIGSLPGMALPDEDRLCGSAKEAYDRAKKRQEMD